MQGPRTKRILGQLTGRVGEGRSRGSSRDLCSQNRGSFCLGLHCGTLLRVMKAGGCSRTFHGMGWTSAE